MNVATDRDRSKQVCVIANMLAVDGARNGAGSVAHAASWRPPGGDGMVIAKGQPMRLYSLAALLLTWSASAAAQQPPAAPAPPPNLGDTASGDTH